MSNGNVMKSRSGVIIPQMNFGAATPRDTAGAGLKSARGPGGGGATPLVGSPSSARGVAPMSARGGSGSGGLSSGTASPSSALRPTVSFRATKGGAGLAGSPSNRTNNNMNTIGNNNNTGTGPAAGNGIRGGSGLRSSASPTPRAGSGFGDLLNRSSSSAAVASGFLVKSRNSAGGSSAATPLTPGLKALSAHLAAAQATPKEADGNKNDMLSQFERQIQQAQTASGQSTPRESEHHVVAGSAGGSPVALPISDEKNNNNEKKKSSSSNNVISSDDGKDLELTRVIGTGNFAPRIKSHASKADIVLTLQEKLRQEYSYLVQPENRGLFFDTATTNSNTNNNKSARGTGAPKLTGRRAAQLSDPTQRATLTIIREDTLLQAGQTPQQQQQQRTTDQIRGSTWVSDALPSRLAGPTGRGLGGVVVLQGIQGIGKATIWKQLLAQQRVPNSIVLHCPLMLLRSFGSNAASALQLWKIEDLVRAVRAPLSLSDVTHIVKHRIPIVWVLDGFESERRNCQAFLHRMVQMRRWRDVSLTVLDGDGGVAEQEDEDDEDEEDEQNGDEEDDIMNEVGNFTAQFSDAEEQAAARRQERHATSAYNFLSRKCDTVIVTSCDGSLSEQDNLAPESLTATSLTNIASLSTQVRRSNVERWIVQRWPQGVTKEFCRKYCTSKGKPYSARRKNPNYSAASAAAKQTSSATQQPQSQQQQQSQYLPAEEVIWELLSAGSMRGFVGVPLFVQCVCDVFLMNEDLLAALADSKNPAVSLFDVCMKLQWTRQLVHIQALLSSSTLGGGGGGDNNNNNATFASADEAYKAMVIAAGSFCVDLIAKGGMECDISIPGALAAAQHQQQPRARPPPGALSTSPAAATTTQQQQSTRASMTLANNESFSSQQQHARSRAVSQIDMMNARTTGTTTGTTAAAAGEQEPLWVKLLTLLGVIRRVKKQQQPQQATRATTSAAAGSSSLTPRLVAGAGPQALSARAANNSNNAAARTADNSFAAAGPTTIIFHNRLLVEYFAASHISHNPDKLSKVAFHTRNRFLWMALALFASENSRLLSQQSFFSRISDKYANEHPLWIDSLVEHIATQFHTRYASLTPDQRHDRKKMVLLAAYTHCGLLVEVSTVLNAEASVLMAAVKRKHGFFGKTLRCPSHMLWSFELCGDYAAGPTLNWIIDTYSDEVTQNPTLLSRTLARALQREQLGGADRAGGVIHRLYQLGATIELFTAVRLGSTTAVAECFETEGFQLDADSYRQCLIISVENRDSDMAALILAHGRCAEYLDAWVVAAIFVLKPRVRFTRKSVQHTMSNNNTMNGSSGDDNSSGRATSSYAAMATLDFLDGWTRNCTGLEGKELDACDSLLHQILKKQMKYEEVHTAVAAGGGGAAATFAAAIASLDDDNEQQQQQQRQAALLQQQGNKSSRPSAAANNDDDDDDSNTIGDFSSTLVGAGGAVAAAAAAASSSNNNTQTRGTGPAAAAATFTTTTANTVSSFFATPGNTTTLSNSATRAPGAVSNAVGPRSRAAGGGRNRAASFFQGFSYGTDWVVEVRVDALFWWVATSGSSIGVKPANDSEINYLVFHELPDSMQLNGIVQSLGECESVKHISLCLQECEALTDSTLIQLVHSAGPKLIELGVTWASDVTDAALLSLTRYCPQLVSLDVTRCYCLTNAALEAAAQHLHHLRSLCIEFCCLCDDHGVITLVEALPQLEHLDVAYCSEITDSAMMVVANKCRNLQSLRICGCEKLTDVSIVTVTLNCPMISSIKFRDITEITSAGVAAVAKNLGPRLRVIDASVCWRIGDEALIALAEHCPNLEEIYFGECSNITDKGVRALASAGAGGGNNNARLRLIDFSGCYKISGAAMAELCVANNAKDSIEHIFASRCDAIDDGFVAAVTAQCRNLVTLHVSFCDLLTDKTLVSVLGNGKKIVSFECHPTPVQERNETFSHYLAGAVAEKTEQRRRGTATSD